ncbi:MAG: T9SS type A sorting domain-containing protein [Fibrobacter sp.]|nr:T9SS type A sorting domain-containing protein [Fibrobacter sp.]
MNKKILYSTVFAMAASAAFGFELWNGTTEQVKTELGNESETEGYWFDYNDSADDGLSSVQWPVAKGNGYDDNSLQPVIEYCSGVCGHVVLSGAALSYDPFIGIGFNVVGQVSKTDKTTVPGDATAWGGICIAYLSTLAPVLELGLGDEKDQALKYDNPISKLVKSSEGTVKDIPWADFAQAGWGTGDKITGPEAAAILVSVKFKIQAKDGLDGDFNIMEIGPYGSGCNTHAVPPPPYDAVGAIKGVRAAAGVKALVSGRTLSFSGISSDATVEVINLQGRVVKKGSVKGAASLDLSSVDAGVYMVRVSGKSVDFSNKIVLK